VFCLFAVAGVSVLSKQEEKGEKIPREENKTSTSARKGPAAVPQSR
jgi:hypothetical protein